MEESKDVLHKREIATDPKFGYKPKERPIKELIEYGLINLNKPAGPTSHQVADYVKKIMNMPKAGHSGTLEE